MHVIALAAAMMLGLVAVPGSPAPEPSSSPLPEIGRTKANPLPCAVLRDLIAPSLGAAMDADAAFGNARAQLLAYGVLMGGRRPNAAAQTLSLMRLNRNVSAMAKDVLTINRALGDPRVSAAQNDRESHALREALQALYEAENGKLNALSGYVEGQYLNQLLGDDESIAQMRGTLGNGAPIAPHVLATPQPFDRGVPARPSLPAAGQTPDPFFTSPPIAPAGARGQLDDRRTADGLEWLASRTIVATAAGCR